MPEMVQRTPSHVQIVGIAGTLRVGEVSVFQVWGLLGTSWNQDSETKHRADQGTSFGLHIPKANQFPGRASNLHLHN